VIPKRANRAFTMVEIMIVVAITGIIVAIAATTWLRQREVSRSRVCQENLSKIDGAKELFAFETNVGHEETPTWTDLVGATLYIKSTPSCPAGGAYSINSINTAPTCDYSLPDFLTDPQYEHQVQH